MTSKSFLRRAALIAAAFVPGIATALQTDIPGPPGSEAFGTRIHTLPNGNLLIVDPEHGDDDEGAIHLYAPDGTRISTFTGSRSGDFEYPIVTVLKSGHAVVANPSWDNGPAIDAGAVTFIDANTGREGVASAQNSLVGTRAEDALGARVIALPKGGYLVQSNYVDLERDGAVVANVGAWTFGRGDIGIAGTISAANSLLAGTAEDLYFSDAIVLSDGNVTLNMPYWDNGTIEDAGAVLWMNGATGATGTISAANAFVGAKRRDQIGQFVTALTQGHYMIGSPSYDDGALVDVGAVTCRRGGAQHPGTITGAESLLGFSAQDYVGFHTMLPNGRVLVNSLAWDDLAAGLANVGAATLISGTAPTVGRITAANSLIGAHANDRIGEGGHVALANGKIVLRSPAWNGEAGAATWLDPVAGLPGQIVSADNSLVGTVAQDRVGIHVVALANGNYVVGCPTCDRGGTQDAGAIVWCDGDTGRSGAVTIQNAITGTSANDFVGSGLVALPNGNYVAATSSWDNVVEFAFDAGAVTWFDGETGIPHGASSPIGELDAWNSLVGMNSGDRVSSGYGPTVLASGDVVVRSNFWDRGNLIDVGAVTWIDGDTGMAGTITSSNSLIGTRRDDRVGSCGVLALPNGAYVVSSCDWDQPGSTSLTTDAGAVTWAKPGEALIGFITEGNSLLPPEGFGEDTGDLALLPNGDFVVHSKHLDVMVGAQRFTDAGAVTLGRARSGVSGTIDANNSVVAAGWLGGETLFVAYSPSTDQLVVGRPRENLVSFFDERLMSDGFE